MKRKVGMVLPILMTVLKVANSQFNVENQDLVKSSKECFEECLARSQTFCLEKDDISQGFCCDGQDCSKYGSPDKFGFCSDQAL